MSLGALFMIVGKSLRQHALSTGVTIASAALASGLVMAVFTISAQSTKAFAGGDFGFHAVLGARGSQLQLVLNSIFHLETSPGNLPWSVYQEVKNDRRVALAIPYVVGDNYKGHRIVGTTTELFTDFEYEKGKRYEIQPGGRIFDPALQEAVIGNTVALQEGLRVGDTFQPYHGVFYNEKDQHDEQYLIVGVMEPTNTPADRVLWIPVEGAYRIEGHFLRGDGENYVAKPDEVIPDEHKEVSAVMLKFRNDNIGMQFETLINKQGKTATLAWPIGTVMGQLFNKLGWVNRVLEAVAYLVVLVAAGSILASLYNTMNERRREFAILRALGAGRGTVFSAIVLEAGAISLLGALAGYMVYVFILYGAAVIVREQTGVVLDLTAMHPALLWTPIGMMLLGAVSGVLPALKAYSTDVANNLIPAS